MRMFRMGLEGGKPTDGEIGVQPEWFYKGDGSCLVGPGEPADLARLRAGRGRGAGARRHLSDRPGRHAVPSRLLPVERVLRPRDRARQLPVARHSKLRQASLGPELLVGALPDHVEGTSRIRRDDELVFDKPFLSGEAKHVAHDRQPRATITSSTPVPSSRRPARPLLRHGDALGDAWREDAGGRPVRDDRREPLRLPLVNTLAETAGREAPVAVRSL